ncbi:MAG: SIMPL domain-containing protein [Clostridia bacterium]|nr:SIMPL domain-containing protein [Clostridia bacterium]
MKKYLKAAVGLAAVLVLSLAMGTSAFAAETEGITVNGRGTVEVAPDTATIYADIETKGASASEAQSKNNKISEAVKTAMKAAGIAEDNIINDYTTVYPDYSYNEKNGENEINGYRAYTSISFATSDIDNAGKYFDTALKAGATGGRVSFSLKNSPLYYAQALKEAVRAANDSAKAIADACGVELGSVKAVTESSSNYYTTEEFAETKSEVMDMAAGVNTNSSTNISYDKISVTARVSITYSIK